MSAKVSTTKINGGENCDRDGDTAVRKANAQKLAAGYTKTKRFCECCYLSISTYLWLSNCISTGRYFVFASDAKLTVLAYMPLYIAAAMALADFVSGIAHWGLDTWGTPDTIIFGNFIRSFREHHVDQTAMCKHDFIETNADTTLPLLPLLLVQFIFMRLSNHSGNDYGLNLHRGNIGVHVFLNTFFLFVALTNEIHKWSHQFKPAAFVRRMMDNGVLLSPVAHRKHHKDPYDCSYCITTGWLNPPLDAIRFWRFAERVVTAVTGEIPRANDQSMLGK